MSSSRSTIRTPALALLKSTKAGVWLSGLAAVASLTAPSCDSLAGFERNNPLDRANPNFVLPAADGFNAYRIGSIVHLVWNDPSIWEDGFIIERAIDSTGAFVTIALVPPNTVRFEDPITFPGFSAQYRLSPYLLKDNSVVRSEARTASVELSSFGAATPVIDLVSETELILRWTDPLVFVTGYVVERRIGLGPFAPIDTVPPSSRSYVDRSGPEGVLSNIYRVALVRDSVRGPVSPIVSIASHVPPPEVVDLVAESSGSLLRLSWSMQPLAAGYRVWRSSPQGTTLMTTLPPDIRQWLDEHPDTNGGVHGYSVATITSYPSPERTARYRPAMVEQHILADAGSPLTCVATAPDGRIIAGGEDRRLTVWSADGALLRRIDLPGIPEAIDVHLTQPWATVAMTSAVGGSGGVEMYDINAGTRVAVLGLPGSFGVFSPDGGRVAVPGAFSTVVVRYITAPDTVALLNVPNSGGVASARFSPDGSKLLVGARGGYAHLFDSMSGALIRTFTCPPTDITSVAFRPDGAVCFVPGGYLRGAYLYDVTSGAMLWHEWTGILRLGVFLSDRRLMTSGASDRTATIWDVTSQQMFLTAPGHTGVIRGLAATVDGVPVTASADGTVRVWTEGKRWFVE